MACVARHARGTRPRLLPTWRHERHRLHGWLRRAHRVGRRVARCRRHRKRRRRFDRRGAHERVGRRGRVEQRLLAGHRRRRDCRHAGRSCVQLLRRWRRLLRRELQRLGRGFRRPLYLGRVFDLGRVEHIQRRRLVVCVARKRLATDHKDAVLHRHHRVPRAPKRRGAHVRKHEPAVACVSRLSAATHW